MTDTKSTMPECLVCKDSSVIGIPGKRCPFCEDKKKSKSAGEFIIEMCNKHGGLMTINKHKEILDRLREEVEGMERPENNYGYEMDCNVLYNQALDDVLAKLDEVMK